MLNLEYSCRCLVRGRGKGHHTKDQSMLFKKWHKCYRGENLLFAMGKIKLSHILKMIGHIQGDGPIFVHGGIVLSREIRL